MERKLLGYETNVYVKFCDRAKIHIYPHISKFHFKMANSQAKACVNILYLYRFIFLVSGVPLASLSGLFSYLCGANVAIVTEFNV